MNLVPVNKWFPKLEFYGCWRIADFRITIKHRFALCFKLNSGNWNWHLLVIVVMIINYFMSNLVDTLCRKVYPFDTVCAPQISVIHDIVHSTIAFIHSTTAVIHSTIAVIHFIKAVLYSTLYNSHHSFHNSCHSLHNSCHSFHNNHHSFQNNSFIPQ